MAEVIWVGLSAVKVDNIASTRPLASDTRSGKLIDEIEAELTGNSFYRTNLVKCFPEKRGKIRYPNRHEMQSCYPNLQNEVGTVSPRVVFLLGKQVAEYVLARFDVSTGSLDKDFRYKAFNIGEMAYVPIHHPSYVLIYQRRSLARYINQICNIIFEHTSTSLRKEYG